MREKEIREIKEALMQKVVKDIKPQVFSKRNLLLLSRFVALLLKFFFNNSSAAFITNIDLVKALTNLLSESESVKI